MDNDLMELRDQLMYAKDDVGCALARAEDLSRDCEYQWQSLNELVRRLSLLSKWLDVVEPTEIKDAIKEAEAYYDRLSDLADAQSY